MARKLAAVAAFVNLRAEQRAVQISGAMDNHRRKVGADWVVTLGDFALHGSRSAFRPMRRHRRPSRTGLRSAVVSDWLPGRSHARFVVDGEPLGVKIDRDRHRHAPALARHGCGGACAQPARRRACPADAGEAAAGHVEDAALPDAGRRHLDCRSLRRPGRGRPGAGHRRGDEDGKRAARRAPGTVKRIAAQGGRQPRGRRTDHGIRVRAGRWPTRVSH